MITIGEVREKHLGLSDDAWAAVVFQASINTVGEKIHLPSYIDGYMEVIALMKNAYKSDPLTTIEALEGSLTKSPFSND